MTQKTQEDLDQYKRQASEYAAQFIESGMVIGLGFGSTAIHALRKIGSMIEEGTIEGIRAVATSDSVERSAREHGIPVVNLDEVKHIDVTIDGADEIDPELNLIKGGGGALLREKIVAQATEREIIVVDYTKLSDELGTRFDLPVEVLPFAWATQMGYIADMGVSSRRRMMADGKPFVTDSGNFILDCEFGPIPAPFELARKLEGRAGVMEHGLFLNLTSEAVVAGPDGIRHLKKE